MNEPSCWAKAQQGFYGNGDNWGESSFRQFRDDAINHFGLTENPKGKKAFNMAWTWACAIFRESPAINSRVRTLAILGDLAELLNA